MSSLTRGARLNGSARELGEKSGELLAVGRWNIKPDSLGKVFGRPIKPRVTQLGDVASGILVGQDCTPHRDKLPGEQLRSFKSIPDRARVGAHQPAGAEQSSTEIPADNRHCVGESYSNERIEYGTTGCTGGFAVVGRM